MRTFQDLMDLMPESTEIGEWHSDGYRPVQLTLNNTIVHCRYYTPADTTAAGITPENNATSNDGATDSAEDSAEDKIKTATQGVIWVGGVGGGWDSPAQQLYPRLAQILLRSNIASLRVRYRQPTQLEMSVMDVLVGIRFLQDQGIESIALVGHSFGGAVVIQAAAETLAVKTVVALAPQSYGTEMVDELATRCSLLLMHGTADPVLSPACSEQIYEHALDPKQLIFYPDAGHSLDEVADEVETVLQQWMIEQLSQDIG